MTSRVRSPVVVGDDAFLHFDVVVADLRCGVRTDDATEERVANVEDVTAPEARLAVLRLLVVEVRADVEGVACAARRHQLLVIYKVCNKLC